MHQVCHLVKRRAKSEVLCYVHIRAPVDALQLRLLLLEGAQLLLESPGCRSPAAPTLLQTHSAIQFRTSNQIIIAEIIYSLKAILYSLCIRLKSRSATGLHFIILIFESV